MQDEAKAAAGGGGGDAPAESAAEENLSTVGLDKLTTVEQVEAALAVPGVSKTRKQRLKQKLNKLQVRSFSSHGAAAQAQQWRLDRRLLIQVKRIHVPSAEISLLMHHCKARCLSAGAHDGQPVQEKPAEESKQEAKGGKPKKVSAAVAAMQRQIEEQRKADEAREAAAAAAKAAAEEEERRLAEEEARREAEKAARAEAKKAKREQLKREGKLLTAKQKEEAKRLAARGAELAAAAKVCCLAVSPAAC